MAHYRKWMFLIFVMTASAHRCFLDVAEKSAYCNSIGLISIPQDLMSDLVYLSLYGNNIEILHSTSFQRYPVLKELYLSNNNISKIDPGAFVPLERLSKLDLSYNPHLPITHNTLTFLSLESFSATKSNLYSLPRGAFKWVYVLENHIAQVNVTCDDDDFIYTYVNLGDNNIQRITKDTFVFECGVYEMDLTYNPIQEIDPSVISSLRVLRLSLGWHYLPTEQLLNVFKGVQQSTVTHLSLESVGLGEITEDLFSHLKGKDLQKFDLSNNKLGHLPEQAFSNLTLVYELILNTNELDSFNPGQFNGMTNLRILSLEDNKIALINQNKHEWDLNITELHLGNNPIKFIDAYSFKNLQTLKILDLSENKALQTIGDDSFADCTSLQSLDLTSTVIGNVSLNRPILALTSLILKNSNFPSGLIKPGKLSSTMPSLERLNLAGAIYNIYNLWDPLKKISSFHGLENLQFLDLSNIPIGSISVPLFANLSQLIELRLGYCGIFEIHSNLFEDLHRLKILDLGHNNLQALNSGVLDGMKDLEYLFLNYNDLTLLDGILFKRNTKLTMLDLSINLLTTLNDSTFRPLFHVLHVVDLSENPLVCNCDIKWVSDWLKGSVTLRNSGLTVCLATSQTLAPFRGKQLITFDPSSECGPNTILYSSLGAAGVLVLLTLVLTYYNRWWIRHKLFLLKLCLKGYEVIIDDVERKNCRYDLNIIFHSSDKEWVNEHLKPSLNEKLPDFESFSCGDDDLMLGMYYLDAVNYAVENSFKIIVVISRAAVQDHWFMLKFRTALDHVNDIGIEKISLIFLEDISSDQLPFLIRLFLSDNRPYLTWTDNSRGQLYFWDKLVKNLKVNIRCNDMIPP